MAGIGFRLQALAHRGSVLEASGAYLSSAVISSGPWLSGLIALVVLTRVTSRYLSASDHALLFATIVAVYAASIVLAGGPQMVVTRYLADCLYRNDAASISPMCAGLFFLLFPFALLALPFLLYAPFDIRYRLLVTTFFLTLTMTWLVVSCLSAAHKYVRIVLIFAVCYALSTVVSILLGYLYGLLGTLAGFTFGQMLCLVLLVVSVYKEFPSPQDISLAYLGYFRRYWDLALVGAVYASGTLVDNILFWASSHAQTVHNFYHIFPPYDTAKLLASLSTIPAAVIFMVHVETNFHRHYQRYYQYIQNKGTLSDLLHAREDMQKACRSGAWAILKFQGLFALFLCLLAHELANLAGLQSRWVPLLRIEILGGVGQFFVFFMMLLLLYLDRRRATLLVVSAFALSNFILTLLSLHIGEVSFGIGYLVATVISAILGWTLFNNRLKHLEYLTFMHPLL